MKFHPVISIILGIIVTITLFGILLPAFKAGTLDSVVVFLIICVFSGFVATYFAKEKKMRYGIYEGIIITIFLICSVLATQRPSIILIGLIFMWIFPAIGGFLGKMTDENNRKKIKTKYLNNGLSSITAIITGIIITYVCSALLQLITGTYIDINNVSTAHFGLANFIVGATAIAIGAFITIYLAKEKKIKYGIYEGIIFIILSKLTKSLLEMAYGVNKPEDYYILLGTVIGYLLASIIGSYLGTMLDKHLKTTAKAEI